MTKNDTQWVGHCQHIANTIKLLTYHYYVILLIIIIVLMYSVTKFTAHAFKLKRYDLIISRLIHELVTVIINFRQFRTKTLAKIMLRIFYMYTQEKSCTEVTDFRYKSLIFPLHPFLKSCAVRHYTHVYLPTPQSWFREAHSPEADDKLSCLERISHVQNLFKMKSWITSQVREIVDPWPAVVCSPENLSPRDSIQSR